MQRHHVRITRPFYMGATEVTRGQFYRFVESEGHRTESPGQGWIEVKSHFERGRQYTWLNPGFPQTDDHPVLEVSWNDAVAFCAWITRKEDVVYRFRRKPSGNTLAGPGPRRSALTETIPRQFRCSETLRIGRSWRDTLTGLSRIPRRWKKAIAAHDGYVYTAPVGKFRPNAFGLYDMLGNVSEYCSDWYAPDYYKESPIDNPTGPPRTSARIQRGGCWFSYPTASARRGLSSAAAGCRDGCRGVRELPQGRLRGGGRRRRRRNGGGTGGLPTGPARQRWAGSHCQPRSARVPGDIEPPSSPARRGNEYEGRVPASVQPQGQDRVESASQTAGQLGTSRAASSLDRGLHGQVISTRSVELTRTSISGISARINNGGNSGVFDASSASQHLLALRTILRSARRL